MNTFYLDNILKNLPLILRNCTCFFNLKIFTRTITSVVLMLRLRVLPVNVPRELPLTRNPARNCNIKHNITTYNCPLHTLLHIPEGSTRFATTSPSATPIAVPISPPLDQNIVLLSPLLRVFCNLHLTQPIL